MSVIAANKSDANLIRNKFGDEQDRYEKRMFLIVCDSFELSAQNPTEAEKASRTETWSRTLFNIIPERMLQTCFDAAFKHHEGTFPISAYEIKDAWPEVKERERQRIIDTRRALPETAESVCSRCNGTGMEVVPGRGARFCNHQENQYENR